MEEGEQIDKQKYGQQAGRQTHRQTERQSTAQIDRQTNGWIRWQIDRQIAWHMGRWINAGKKSMDRQTGRPTYRRTDGLVDRFNKFQTGDRSLLKDQIKVDQVRLDLYGQTDLLDQDCFAFIGLQQLLGLPQLSQLFTKQRLCSCDVGTS